MPAVKGISAMQAACARFLAQLQAKAPQAVEAGAEVIAEEVRARAPVGKTQKLAASVRVRESLTKNGVRAEVIAGGPQAPEAVWVEYGTAAHALVPKHSHALVIDGHLVSHAKHPGAAPKPFFRPAVQTKKSQAASVMAATLRGDGDDA